MEGNIESLKVLDLSETGSKANNLSTSQKIKNFDMPGTQASDFFDLKISMFGPSQSAKSSIVKLLKGENRTSVYNETWCVQVNVIEWAFSKLCQVSVPNEEKKIPVEKEEGESM